MKKVRTKCPHKWIFVKCSVCYPEKKKEKPITIDPYNVSEQEYIKYRTTILTQQLKTNEPHTHQWSYYWLGDTDRSLAVKCILCGRDS